MNIFRRFWNWINGPYREMQPQWLEENEIPRCSGYYWMIRKDSCLVIVEFERDFTEWEETEITITEFGCEKEYEEDMFRFWSVPIAAPGRPVNG